MALERAKSPDLWRWKAQKMPIYGVRKCKKFRFMALENIKSVVKWLLSAASE